MNPDPDATQMTSQNGTFHQKTRLRMPLKERDSRTLPELLAELRDESVHLLRQEWQLGLTEMRSRSKKLARGAALPLLGSLFLVFALFFGLLAAAGGLLLLLDDVVGAHAFWLSPVIIAGFVAVLGIVLILLRPKTKDLKNDLKPRHSLDSLRRDKEMLKSHLHS